MALALYAYKIESDGSIDVCHIFFGENEKECDEKFAAHAAHCPQFGPAVKRGDVVSFYDKIKELPDRESVEAEISDDED